MSRKLKRVNTPKIDTRKQLNDLLSKFNMSLNAVSIDTKIDINTIKAIRGGSNYSKDKADAIDSLYVNIYEAKVEARNLNSPKIKPKYKQKTDMARYPRLVKLTKQKVWMRYFVPASILNKRKDYSEAVDAKHASAVAQYEVRRQAKNGQLATADAV